MTTNTNVNVNLPIFGMLGLIFITLKLTGYIAWSWLWVLSPFWVPVVLFLTFVAIAAICASFLGRK